MMSLSVSCNDGDIKVHNDFTTVMVLSSINTSESSLQRGSITGCCVNGMSVGTMLPVSISFQEQSLTNHSHLARSTEETNMTTVNGSFSHWLKMPWSKCSCSTQVPTCQWSNMWLQLYFLQQHSARKGESKVYPCFIWVEMIGPSWSSSSSMRRCRLYQNIGWLCCGIAWTYGT